jgi:hypothetical protein
MTATLPVVPHSDREAKALVLVLHAFDNTPADMVSIGATVKTLRPASHVVIPRLPLRRAARVNPLDVARNLVDLIEDQIAFRGSAEFVPKRTLRLRRAQQRNLSRCQGAAGLSILQLRSHCVAGSVVRSDYDWGRHIARGKVQAVLNYVATADVIVAVLPGAWEMVDRQDLGSAGHNGFRIPHEKVFQTKFVRGRHSCAREEDNWNDIAEFIVSPAPGPTKSPLLIPNQNWLVVMMGRTAPFWWLVIVALLYGLGWMAVRTGIYFRHPVIALFIYLWLLWQIVSKL